MNLSAGSTVHPACPIKSARRVQRRRSTRAPSFHFRSFHRERRAVRRVVWSHSRRRDDEGSAQAAASAPRAPRGAATASDAAHHVRRPAPGMGRHDVGPEEVEALERRGRGAASSAREAEMPSSFPPRFQIRRVHLISPSPPSSSPAVDSLRVRPLTSRPRPPVRPVTSPLRPSVRPRRRRKRCTRARTSSAAASTRAGRSPSARGVAP